ncbi:CHAT domain-containing protein [Microcoleus sp. S28C3]|uniref:nSTAND1 domain-containing NTPase n=1 Tax=Microcoleus sp. S28C3 TaxID=3055414 RepID=UPI002FD37002
MTNNNSVKTILILAANPTNTVPLRLEQEVREIEEGLRRANKREQYKLEQKWAVRSRDFYRAILDYQPNIVHFCGHGAGADGIVLEDDTGKMALVQTNALASMFKLFAQKGVDCVILNACYSEVQAEAISQYVNYVIGMNRAVGDKAALAFAVGFYDAIAAGYTLEEAYDLGCSQMMSFREQETPVFKKKNLIDSPSAQGVVAVEDVIPPNPYQGLSAFGEEDTDFFFGQENFVSNLVEVTHKQPLVAVVGPSGSGKSSVVYAGLIPQLRKEGNWLIESFRPGKEPFVQLAFALVRQLEPEAGETQQLRETMGLAGDLRNGRITLQQLVCRILERNPGKRLLLVADQFEELYTFSQLKKEQEHFADGLLTAIAQENITLVLALRADFYGYALSYRPLRDAFQEYTPQLLSSMKGEELQAAIELPAKKLEVEFEAQLTQRILDDVEEEPGNLPLLEFAVTRLWEKQINRELTHQAYEEIGGVKKAIANHAEQVYQKLSETEKKQAQRIFVQLVRPGEGTEDTRRVASRAAVGEDNWNLVSYLAGYQARLVVTGRQEQEDTVELVHETLIRQWGTLREWINANRQFRTWQERLKVALREWKNDNHDSWAMLRGVSLTVAEDWLRQRADEMTQEERDFIQVSVKERDRERQKDQRRRRLTIIGLSGFSAIALGLAGLAGVGWWRAAINQIYSLAQYSDGLLNFDGSKALKTSLKAVLQMRRTPWVDADTRTYVELSLLNTVANVAAPNTLGSHTGKVNAVSFSPNGKLLATASDDRTVRLWDASTGKQIQILTGHTDVVNAVSFSPNSKLLATASNDKTVKVWDTSTGKQLKTLSRHRDSVYLVSFSPNGKLLAAGSNDNTVKLWDTSTGKQIQTIRAHKNGVNDLSFSPNSKLLATAGGDKTVKLWDTFTGKQIKTLSGHTDWVWKVSFSPDGKRLATGSDDNTVKLWDTSTGKQIQTLSGHTGSVGLVSFSPNGKLLATGSSDKTVKLWDTSTGKEIKTLSGHTDAVIDFSFSPNGKLLATGSNEKTVKLWDTSTGKQIKTLSGHTDSVRGVSFSPDGKLLATRSDDNTVKLWDITGKQIKTLSGHKDKVWNVSFSPNSKLLVTGSDDNTVRLWDTSTNKQIKTLSGHTGEVNAVSFSPNGKLLATASDDKTVKLWDVSTGKQIHTLSGHTSVVNAVSFSPNDKLLVTGSDDKTVKLWDSSTGKQIKTLSGHTDLFRGVSFSPDGKLLATRSNDKTVKLWDTSTGKETKTLSGHTDLVKDVSFSPDGKLLAANSSDKTVKLWDTSTGKEIKTLSGHTSSLYAVSFSPDGKLLATSSWDKTVKLWDTSTGKEIKTLSGHTNGVLGVSFSPDGKLLATGSFDKTVKLWDISTGKEIKTLSGHGGTVLRVSFSPDGKLLVTGGLDRKVKLWQLDFNYSLKEGCNFTDNYLIPNPYDADALEIKQDLCKKL